jgi:predicted transcriptional regulator
MPVADIMEKEFLVAEPSETAETAFARLQRAASRSMPVLQKGDLVGIVTSENVGEFLMVQAALHKDSGNAGPMGPRFVKRFAT